MEFKCNQETNSIYFIIFLLGIINNIINKFARYHENSICTYDFITFRHFQIDYCKTVVSDTHDGLAVNEKHGLHL